MDATLATRISLPLLLLAFVIVLMVWPVVRLRRETGAWAVTLHRETAPGQRVVAGAFLAMQLAALAFVATYALRGPAPLGVWPFPASSAWLGLGVGLAGLLLVAMAQRQMGTSFRIGIDDAETALVQEGLFTVVRNPIFSSLLVLLAGMFLAVPCLWTLGLWVVAAVTVGKQVRLEEGHLLEQHGDAYRNYASRVGRFFPGVGRLAGRPAKRSGA
ncbi:MAG: isoprenylcysteine carboxylmethyltransferase family protein [Deltaproteobacteria bacterium]|nr:isoprenylcysteine carboxylmethyltransferase family protein [Deltaproteobacteria bacterium]